MINFPWLKKAIVALLAFKGRLSLVQTQKVVKWWEDKVMEKILESPTWDTPEMHKKVAAFCTDLYWTIIIDRPHQLECDWRPSGLLEVLAKKHDIPGWAFPDKTRMRLYRHEVSISEEIPKTRKVLT